MKVSQFPLEAEVIDSFLYYLCVYMSMSKVGVSASIDLETIMKMDNIAKETGKSRSQVITDILELFGNGNLTVIKEIKCFKCGAVYNNKVGNCPMCSKVIEDDKQV